MLDKHPRIKSMFSLRFNTSIPSSTAAKRLFNNAALMLTKKRNRFSDEAFEHCCFYVKLTRTTN